MNASVSFVESGSTRAIRWAVVNPVDGEAPSGEVLVAHITRIPIPAHTIPIPQAIRNPSLSNLIGMFFFCFILFFSGLFYNLGTC